MNQKCQYAVRAVFELARSQGERPAPAARLAEAQYIPVRFLENILSQLRQAGIVESVRGKEGGYRLARPPRHIAVGEVIRVIQGPIESTDCAESAATAGACSQGQAGRDVGRRAASGVGSGAGRGRECPLRPGCVLLPVWDRAHRAMMDVFDGTTFADLVNEDRTARTTQGSDVVDYAI